MRNYLKDACEEISTSLYNGDDFLDTHTRKEFETYLRRWTQKLDEINEDISNQEKESRFRNMSDDELKNEYKSFKDFQPIGQLYSSIRADFLSGAIEEMKRRGFLNG